MKSWVILISSVVLIKSIMFISYPFGGFDDDQQYQRHMIGQISEGNLNIGNIRYNTGYVFFIAPVEVMTSNFGSFSDRIVLLFQLGVSALVPLCVFDILQHYLSKKRALFIAFLITIYPFGLQWAHFQLPVWLVPVYFIIALWFIYRAFQSERPYLWFSGAALLLGFAVITRINIIPVVASIGIGILLFSDLSWKKRLGGFFIIGIVSLSVLVSYLVLIHYPSTNTLTPSCISGTNLIIGANEKQVPLQTSNGVASQYYAELLTLTSDIERTFYQDSYPLWQITGPWVSPNETTDFLAQPIGDPESDIKISFPANLIYYLGPCETDQLLRDVYTEAILQNPLRFMVGWAETVVRILIQTPFSNLADNQYLPKPQEIIIAETYSFGFVSAMGDFYNGQTIWLPGVYLYSALYNLTGWITIFAPFGLVWALFFQKNWFYRMIALMLVVGTVSLSLIAIIQPRIYASLWVLYAIMIFGFIDALVHIIYRRLKTQSESE